MVNPSGVSVAATPNRVPASTVASTKVAARTDNVAHITVKLPAKARLWIDQVECPLTSSVRSFDTPPLQPGQRYAYTMRIQLQRDGETVNDSKRVEVAAGRQVEVNFEQLTTTATAQR
jgi:uncharacterized protein (TIGR03000 family)